MKIKNSVLLLMVAAILVLNVGLFLRYRKGQHAQPISHDQLPGVKTGELAPSFALTDLEGNLHSTDELEDSVALLVFCDIRDERSLEEAYYYKLLLGKYQDRGFAVWVVTQLENGSYAGDLAKAYSPIPILIDQDGAITKTYCNGVLSRFRVFLKDRNGKVVFRDYDAPNMMVGMWVERYVTANGQEPMTDEFTNRESLPPMEYYDVGDGEVKKVEDRIGSPLLLTLFSANCPTCREHHRLVFMQSMSEKYSHLGLQVLLIYARDNPVDIIREYAQGAGLSFDVGVRKVEPDELDKYYTSYDLRTDPKSVVVDSDGNIVFVEGLRDGEKAIRTHLDSLMSE